MQSYCRYVPVYWAFFPSVFQRGHSRVWCVKRVSAKFLDNNDASKAFSAELIFCSRRVFVAGEIEFPNVTVVRRRYFTAREEIDIDSFSTSPPFDGYQVDGCFQPANAMTLCRPYNVVWIGVKYFWVVLFKKKLPFFIIRPLHLDTRFVYRNYTFNYGNSPINIVNTKFNGTASVVHNVNINRVYTLEREKF